MNRSRSRALKTGSIRNCAEPDRSAIGSLAIIRLRSTGAAEWLAFGCSLGEPAGAVAAVRRLRKRRDPGIALSLRRGITEVEDGRATWHLLRLLVERAEQSVPAEIGDSEVPGLVVEMMCEVEALDPLEEAGLRRVPEMLHAVAELVKAGGDEP